MLSRRKFIASLGAITGASFASAPALGQFAVVDVKAIAQAVKQSAQQAEQIRNQIQQVVQQATMIQNQIRAYQNMIINTAALPAQVWGQTMEAIREVNNLVGQAKTLSYQSVNLDREIAQRYRGYGSYAAGGLTVTGLVDKYEQWSTEANASTASTLAAIGLQNRQFGDEEALMAQLEQMGATAEGQVQAIQVGNQMAAQAVRQTQKLRQLVMLQTQLHASVAVREADRIAALEARRRTLQDELHPNTKFKLSGKKW